VTLGHYVGKSEAQLRAGWQVVADFIEAAAGIPAVSETTGRRHASANEQPSSPRVAQQMAFT
jgi:hypothetical protein